MDLLLRPLRPLACSNCKQTGHNKRRCSHPILPRQNNQAGPLEEESSEGSLYEPSESEESFNDESGNEEFFDEKSLVEEFFE
jgi:hypothetical protein